MAKQVRGQGNEPKDGFVWEIAGQVQEVMEECDDCWSPGDLGGNSSVMFSEPKGHHNEDVAKKVDKSMYDFGRGYYGMGHSKASGRGRKATGQEEKEEGRRREDEEGRTEEEA